MASRLDYNQDTEAVNPSGIPASYHFPGKGEGAIFSTPASAA